jgi:Flagellar basal body rod FlgEFG protein C-terminal
MSKRHQVLRAPVVCGGMDKISGTLQTALGGMQSSLKRLREAAHDIAGATGQRSAPIERVDSLVRALAAQRALEASAQMVKRADEMLGSLLDTFV